MTCQYPGCSHSAVTRSSFYGVVLCSGHAGSVRDARLARLSVAGLIEPNDEHDLHLDEGD